MFQTQVRIHLFQAAILFFQFLHPPHFTNAHPTIFGFPFVEGSFAEPILAAEIFHRHSRFGFLQDIHNLALRKLRLLYGNLSDLYFAMSCLLFPGTILREGYREMIFLVHLVSIPREKSWQFVLIVWLKIWIFAFTITLPNCEIQRTLN